MKYLFFIIFIFLSLNTYSQTERPFMIIPKIHYGFILPHHENMEYIIKDRVPAIDIMVGIPLLGKQQWQQVYNYPTIGGGFYHAALGNPNVLGTANSVYAFMTSPYFKIKKYSFDYNVSLGFSYITKWFDYKDNFYNFAIGTPINIHVNFNFEHKYQITDKITLFSGLGFTHYSNGAFKMPNYGLNVISATAGASYLFAKTKPERIKTEIPKFKKKYEFQISSAVGLNGSYPVSADLYFLSGLSASFGRQYNHKRGLAIGTELFYNKIKSNYFKNRNIDYSNADLLHMGIFVSYDVILGKITFSIQPGYYLFKKFEDNKPIYEKITFKYKFSKHFFYNISIIAYYANAQYAETGLGFYF